MKVQHHGKVTEDFVCLPNQAITDARLSAEARVIYAHLRSHKSNAWDTDRERIAKELGLSLYKTKQAMSQLTEHGYIKSTPVPTDKGTYLYVLHTHFPPLSGDRTTDSGSDDTPAVRESDNGEAAVRKPVVRKSASGRPDSINQRNSTTSREQDPSPSVVVTPKRLTKSVDVSLTDEDGNYVSKRDRGITPDPSVSYRRRVGVVPERKMSPREAREASKTPSVKQPTFSSDLPSPEEQAVLDSILNGQF